MQPKPSAAFQLSQVQPTASRFPSILHSNPTGEGTAGTRHRAKAQAQVTGTRHNIGHPHHGTEQQRHRHRRHKHLTRGAGTGGPQSSEAPSSSQPRRTGGHAPQCTHHNQPHSIILCSAQLQHHEWQCHESSSYPEVRLAQSQSQSQQWIQQRTDHPCSETSSTSKWNGTSSSNKRGIINCKSSMGGEL